MTDRKKLKGAITIGRPSYGDGRELMVIQFRDELSRVRFLDIEMSLPDLMKALTGQAEMPIEMQVRGLENVGKVKETKRLDFEVTDTNREAAADLAPAYADEGWQADLYFNSQDSFSQVEFSCKHPLGGKESNRRRTVTQAHTTQYRYVEEKP